MKTSFLSATLAVSSGVSALPQNTPKLPNGASIISARVPASPGELAPALPLHQFETHKFTTLFTPEDIRNRVFEKNDTAAPEASSFRTFDTVGVAATCSNPRVRIEWDSYSDSDRQAYVNSIKCLQSRPPSGQFQQSRSRYEDLVSLHQNLTPNVHGNAKFLIWHRYYLWMFEDIMRSECGFDRALPWWDETRYAGRFADSSIFSDQWFGGVSKYLWTYTPARDMLIIIAGADGNCITNGVSHVYMHHSHIADLSTSNLPTLPSTWDPAPTIMCIVLPATTTIAKPSIAPRP